MTNSKGHHHPKDDIDKIQNPDVRHEELQGDSQSNSVYECLEKARARKKPNLDENEVHSHPLAIVKTREDRKERGDGARASAMSRLSMLGAPPPPDPRDGQIYGLMQIVQALQERMDK